MTTRVIPDLIENFRSRNLIINGDMKIAQRADLTGLTATGGTGTYGGPDRWQTYIGPASGTFAVVKESLTSGAAYDDGFSNAWRVDCTTADASIDAGTVHLFRQQIEGQNLQHLLKGSSAAKSLTVSFWVKSNFTGNLVVALSDGDNNRFVASLYSIDVTNTWEKKVVTFPGDTTGVLNDDSNSSLEVRWHLSMGSNFTSGTLPAVWESGVGSANKAPGQGMFIGDNTANNWAITGVQLEVGSTTSEFDHQSYGDELLRCMRYYERWPGVPTNGPRLLDGRCTQPVQTHHTWLYHVRKRSSPTFTKSSNTGFKIVYGTSAIGTSTVTGSNLSDSTCFIDVIVPGGTLSANWAVGLVGDGTTNWIAVDAEL